MGIDGIWISPQYPSRSLKQREFTVILAAKNKSGLPVSLYRRYLLDCGHEIIAARPLREKDRAYCHVCKKYAKVLKETT